MALRIAPGLLGIALLLGVALSHAQSGLRIGAEERLSFSLSSRSAPYGLAGAGGLRLDLDAQTTSSLLRRFTPGVSDWVGYGWGVRLGLRNDRAHMSPRPDQFTLLREFGEQRISYSIFSSYRPTPAFSTLAAPAFAPPVASGAYRLRWSYALGEHGSVGVSYASAGATDYEPLPPLSTRLYGQLESRNVTLHGRYGFASGWAISAEATAYDSGNPGGNLGLRLGVRHGF